MTNVLPRVFAVVSDGGYFAGLHALLTSIWAYHRTSIPVYVYYRGLSENQIAQLRVSGAEVHLFKIEELPFPCAGTWEAKQQVFAHCMGRADNVYLLDADLVLVSRVDDLFEFAASGKIVSSSDGGNRTYGAEYGVYGPGLPGLEQPYINSGALCLNVVRHWDLVGLWAFAAQYAAYSPGGGEPLRLAGHGDQGTFNAIAAILNKTPDFHVLPEGTWCDCAKGSTLKIKNRLPDGRIIVWNVTDNARQRLVHSSGPKWWTEAGAKYMEKFGDKYACFQHFAKLVDRSKWSRNIAEAKKRLDEAQQEMEVALAQSDDLSLDSASIGPVKRQLEAVTHANRWLIRGATPPMRPKLTVAELETDDRSDLVSERIGS